MKLGKGDLPGLLGLFAPEIAWMEAQCVPYFGGTWTRPQQVVEGLLGPLSRHWSGFSASPRSFVVEQEEVVAFGAYGGTCKATSKSIDAPFAHRWRVQAGKIAAFTQYTDTAMVLKAMR